MARRVALYAMLAVIGVCFAVVLVYTWPKKVEVALDGILFRLGEENTQFADRVAFRMQGRVTRDIMGERTFKGIVDIDGYVSPVRDPERQVNKEVEIHFSSSNTGTLHYSYDDGYWPNRYEMGQLIVNDDFTNVVMVIFEEVVEPWDEQIKQGVKSWAPHNGLTIAAPAESREEAYRMTRELVKQYWWPHSSKLFSGAGGANR